MAEISRNSPTPARPAVKIPPNNALQSKRLADAIASAGREIRSALGDPDLLLVLAPNGYNENALHEGLALVRFAQEKFTVRQHALAAATEAKAERDHAFANAKMTFSAYRQTVQVNYTGADRANLGASGSVPENIEKFRTNARGAYTNALRSPYAGVLARHGFTPERLSLALAAIDELSATASACETAQGAALAATAVRDEAGTALASWMLKFRKVARVAVKSRP